MASTKVLITVKTYPTLSTKYDELVCTAGLREDGSWIRVYPIQFRQLDYSQQYKKYEWVEIDLVKNEKDFRPESFRPRTHECHPVVVGKIDTKNNWAERKGLILQNVRTNLTQLIEDARTEKTSLTVFKPKAITKFSVKVGDREWPLDKLQLLQQQNIFQPQEGKPFEVVRRLPFSFHYTFEDETGRSSTMMLEDWEIGALYWNCLQQTGGDEKAACEKVRQKYFHEFVEQKDLYFFLGTRFEAHAKNYANPFSIIGLFYPQKEKPKAQLSLFG